MKEKNSSEIILISDEIERKSVQNENIENNETEIKFNEKDEKEVEKTVEKMDIVEVEEKDDDDYEEDVVKEAEVEVEVEVDVDDEVSDAGADGVSGKDRGLYNLSSFHTKIKFCLSVYLFINLFICLLIHFS